MAYLTIQINCPSLSVADMSKAIEQGDSTKAHEAVNDLCNLLNGINLGTIAASISATSSTNTGTVSGQTGGTTATFNLL